MYPINIYAVEVSLINWKNKIIWVQSIRFLFTLSFREPSWLAAYFAATFSKLTAKLIFYHSAPRFAILVYKSVRFYVRSLNKMAHQWLWRIPIVPKIQNHQRSRSVMYIIHALELVRCQCSLDSKLECWKEYLHCIIVNNKLNRPLFLQWIYCSFYYCCYLMSFVACLLFSHPV